MNTAAQCRESVLSHGPTFLFTVLAMVSWEKMQCHVFSTNCKSIQWAGFSSAEVSGGWTEATELTTSVSRNEQQSEAPRN